MKSTHPLIGDIGHLSLDELGEKINDLNKKLSFAGRINNPSMINQLRLIIESYRNEYQRKQAEIWNKASPDTKGKIDIT